MKSLYKINIICVMFLYLFLFSCPRQGKLQTEIPAGSGVSKSSDESANITLDNAYIEPSPTYDILLNTSPTTANKITDIKKIVEDIKQSVDAEGEILKYLEQKRQYVKTSIFAETP